MASVHFSWFDPDSLLTKVHKYRVSRNRKQKGLITLDLISVSFSNPKICFLSVRAEMSSIWWLPINLSLFTTIIFFFSRNPSRIVPAPIFHQLFVQITPKYYYISLTCVWNNQICWPYVVHKRWLVVIYFSRDSFVVFDYSRIMLSFPCLYFYICVSCIHKLLDYILLIQSLDQLIKQGRSYCDKYSFLGAFHLIHRI